MPCNKEALLKRLKKLSLNIQVSGRELGRSCLMSVPGLDSDANHHVMVSGEIVAYRQEITFLCLPQDDRMRNPLLKLKLAVCSVMPEQIAKYNMECMAKVAK